MSDQAALDFSPTYPPVLRIMLRGLALLSGLAIGWDVGMDFVAKSGQPSWQGLCAALAAMAAVIILLGLLMRVLGAFVSTSDPWILHLLDAQQVPSVIASGHGQVIAANAAYRSLCARMGRTEPVSLPLLFGQEGAFSQALYRLVQASNEMQILKETVRVDGSGKRQKPALWHMQVRPLPPHSVHGNTSLWQCVEEEIASPVIEPAYDSLREAAEALDQAPVGYLALNSEGKITQINATLASWLHWDLALFFPGEHSVHEIVAHDVSHFVENFDSDADKPLTAFMNIPLLLRRADGKEVAVRAVFAADRMGHSDLRVIFVADWFAGDAPFVPKTLPKADPSLHAPIMPKSDTVFFTHAPMAADPWLCPVPPCPGGAPTHPAPPGPP